MRLATWFPLFLVFLAPGCSKETPNSLSPTALSESGEKKEWWVPRSQTAFDKDETPEAMETYLLLSTGFRLETTDDKKFRLTVDDTIVEGTMTFEEQIVRFVPTTVDGAKLGPNYKAKLPTGPGSQEYYKDLYNMVSNPIIGAHLDKNQIFVEFPTTAIAFFRASTIKKTVSDEEKPLSGYWRFPSVPAYTPGKPAVKTAKLLLLPDNHFSLNYPVIKAGTWSMKDGVVTFSETEPDADFPLPSGTYKDGKLQLTIKEPSQTVTLTKDLDLP